MTISRDLLRAFIDEDTETWIAASIKIGESGADAEQLLREHLPTRANIHSHRHAWCVLARHLGVQKPDDSLEMEIVLERGKKGDKTKSVAIKPWVQKCIVETVLAGLCSTEVTIGKAKVGLQGFSEKIQALCDETRTAIGEQEKKGRPQAVAQKRAALELLTTDETELRAIGKYLKPKPPLEVWAFSSLIAGATPGLLEYLGVSLDLFVRAMAELAREGADRIGYVSNVPRVLLQLPEDSAEKKDRLARLAEDLVKAIPPPEGDVSKWIVYLDWLQDLVARANLSDGIANAGSVHKDMMSSDLWKAFHAWNDATNSTKERAAIALARRAEAEFCPELAWREKQKKERFGLVLFFLAAKQPGAGSDKWKTFSFEHRLSLVRQNIQKWQRENQEVLGCLVRLLKMMFNDELRAIPDEHSPLDVCRRQIYWIHPLVAAWNLRGTVNKDLATIAARVLSRACDYCEMAGQKYEEYVELLYTILYALPERSLLKDMRAYAQNRTVRSHLESLVGFIEAPAEPETRREHLGGFCKAVFEKTSHEVLNFNGNTVAALVDWLGEGKRSGGADCDTPDARERALRWMIRQRVRWEVETSAGDSSKRGIVFAQEIEREIKTKTERAVQAIQSVAAERDAHEHSTRKVEDPRAVVASMRRSREAMHKLQELSSMHLPFAERETVTRTLELKCVDLEQRLATVTAIVDAEDEAAAKTAIDPSQDKTDSLAPEDRTLIVKWMLRRFMLSELAQHRSSVLRRLLSPGFVGLWIVAPFLCSALLYCILKGHPQIELVWRGLPFVLDTEWVWGLPFVLIVPANLWLFYRYLSQTKTLPGWQRASLVLSQMVCTLFYGILQSFSSDETWSLGVLGNPIIRLFTFVIYLGASYLLVRYVMLKDQLSTLDRPKQDVILRKRAISVLALGIWQAFALISFFSLLMGGVMSSSSRANLAELPDLDVVSGALAHFLPHAITINGMVKFVVFPWAIVTWTVQLFFFGAVFERIINQATR